MFEKVECPRLLGIQTIFSVHGWFGILKGCVCTVVGFPRRLSVQDMLLRVQEGVYYLRRLSVQEGVG